MVFLKFAILYIQLVLYFQTKKYRPINRTLCIYEVVIKLRVQKYDGLVLAYFIRHIFVRLCYN